MEPYKFNPEQAFTTIKSHWTRWSDSVGANGFVVGISGGVDSSVTAALAARIFGNDKVLGVLMPNGVQKDISDSVALCNHLGIPKQIIDIEQSYKSLLQEIELAALDSYGGLPTEDTRINLAPRLRMAALFGLCQSMDKYFVVNTCNLSESTCGYDTLFGDDAGSYAPIQGLTKTEVIALGDWLGLPHNLTHKTPIDGLQPKTDEEKLGLTYADLDRYIREDIGTPELKAKVDALYRRNKFKTDMVQIPHPDFDYLGNFVRYNNLPDVRGGLVK